MKVGDLVTIGCDHPYWGTSFGKHCWKLVNLSQSGETVCLQAIEDTEIMPIGGRKPSVYLKGKHFCWNAKDIIPWVEPKKALSVGNIVTLTLYQDGQKWIKAFGNGRLFQINTINCIIDSMAKLVPLYGSIDWNGDKDFYNKKSPFLWPINSIKFVADSKATLPDRYKRIDWNCLASIGKTKEKVMKKKGPLSAEFTYRINQGQLGGRKMVPLRISKDGHFAFFHGVGKDVRVHSTHLTKLTPQLLKQSAVSKEAESMDELHIVADTLITTENMIRIEKLKQDLMRRSETNKAEVFAIKTGTKADTPINWTAWLGWVLAIATTAALILK